MSAIFAVRAWDFRSGNRKAKTCAELRRSIENVKLVGCLAILLLLTGWVRMVEAQQQTKLPRIGYLTASSLSAQSARIEAFRQGLRELGYVEGKNIVIEWRYAEGKFVDELRAVVGIDS